MLGRKVWVRLRPRHAGSRKDERAANYMAQNWCGIQVTGGVQSKLKVAKSRTRDIVGLILNNVMT